MTRFGATLSLSFETTTLNQIHRQAAKHETDFFDETANIAAVSTVAGVAGIGVTILAFYAFLSRIWPRYCHKILNIRIDRSKQTV